MNTKQAAEGEWPDILHALGIDQSTLRNKRGPCPACGGKDRFRFDDKEGRGTYYCNACGAGDGLDLVMKVHNVNFQDAASMVDKIIGRTYQKCNAPVYDEKAKKRDRLKQIFGRATPAKGGANPVSAYLHSRALCPSSKILYHPDSEYWLESGEKIIFPAMVLPYHSSQGDVVSAHVTYLTQSGEKADVPICRKIMPPTASMTGAVLRLTDIHHHIGIAEGVETALAVMKLYGVRCWAAGNTAQLQNFSPPEGIKSVTIYADNDANFAGAAAAYKLAHRLHSKFEITVEMPSTVGIDYADMWADQ